MSRIKFSIGWHDTGGEIRQEFRSFLAAAEILGEFRYRLGSTLNRQLISRQILTTLTPIPAWQLTVEWGEDTDSYAQLLGAFLGALYGASLFSEKLRKPVELQLSVDYDQDLHFWARFLRDL